jgi:hypothetical protein
MKAINIKWETDGEDIELPTEITLPDYLILEKYDIAEYLSQTEGWLVNSFELHEYRRTRRKSPYRRGIGRVRGQFSRFNKRIIMKLSEIFERGFTCNSEGRVLDENGNIFCLENGESAKISYEDLIKVKTEAVMRYESENEPYKFRDVRARLWYGRVGYKDLEPESIEVDFEDFECSIIKQDIEWAIYQDK